MKPYTPELCTTLSLYQRDKCQDSDHRHRSGETLCQEKTSAEQIAESDHDV